MKTGYTMQSRVEQQVMASVGVIYGARLLSGRIAIELYALALSALALWQLTWVHKVFANFAGVEHGGLAAVGQYLSYAFLHTHLLTQAVLLVALAASIAFAIDAIRTLLRPHPRLYFR